MNSVETIPDFLNRLRCEYSPETAFTMQAPDGGFRNVTYGGFVNDVFNLAGTLAPCLSGERRAAIAAENSYEWLVFYWAVMLLGKTAVLCDPELPWDELDENLTSLGVHTVFTRNAAIPTRKLRKIPMALACAPISDTAVQAFPEGQPDNECTILFTTGTTGIYKSVCLSQRNLVTAVIYRTVEFADDVFLALPFFHSLTVNGLITAMFFGRRVFIGNGPKYVLKDLLSFEPQMLLATPVYLNLLYKKLLHLCPGDSPKTIWGRNFRYLFNGGASPQQKVMEAFMENGVQLVSSYGTSETFSIASGNIGTTANYAGILAPHMQVRLDNGEIVVKGPTVFMGYASGNAGALEDGWYHTGDLGYIDSGNRLFLTGRKNNLIILSNGKNISPEYLEEKLGRIPQIAEAVVYASEDKIQAEIDLGQNPENGAKDSVLEAVHELNLQLPTYYQIRNVIFRNDGFQYRGIGKIKRTDHTKQ